MKIATVAASAILAATTLSCPVAASAADPASLALDYLGTRQLADGSIDVSSAGGFGNPGTTEDFIIGASAAGIDPHTLKRCNGVSAYDWLASDIVDATKNAGRTAKLILALVAGGRDPRAFTSHDLIASLVATYVPATGAYGEGGAFTQSLAILALKSGDPTHPVPAMATQHLETIQDADGGWGTGGISDTNATALALEALKALDDATGRSAALSYLHTQQDSAGGGFILSSGYGPPPYFSDPDSDALVIQALIAVGQDPSSPAWSAGGKNALLDLLTFQDSTSASTTYGGFLYFKPQSPSNQPDTTTTSQVPAALAGRALPVLPTYRAGTSLPAGVCPPAPAASPAAVPTPGLPQAGGGFAADLPGMPGWLSLTAALMALVGALSAAFFRGKRVAIERPRGRHVD